jgi:hypothetical protein
VFRFLAQVIDKTVSSEGQDNFRCSELTKYPGDVTYPDVRVAALIEEEDRAPCAGLPQPDCGDDVVERIFERRGLDDDVAVLHLASALIEYVAETGPRSGSIERHLTTAGASRR